MQCRCPSVLLFVFVVHLPFPHSLTRSCCPLSLLLISVVCCAVIFAFPVAQTSLAACRMLLLQCLLSSLQLIFALLAFLPFVVVVVAVVVFRRIFVSVSWPNVRASLCLSVCVCVCVCLFVLVYRVKTKTKIFQNGKTDASLHICTTWPGLKPSSTNLPPF